jgi:hypothetical protein
MSNPVHEATEQLRAIRALMERSTIYRAISGPAALFAGVLSLAVSGWLWTRRDPQDVPSPIAFLSIWVAVLLVVSLVNTLLLYRHARQRGDVFVSSGMKHALRTLLPPLVAGFITTLVTVTNQQTGSQDCYADVAAHWILFYGLALLAAGSFSPRSMYCLGGGFFLVGILTFLPPLRFDSQYPAAVIFMASSFGLLHIVYAAAVWIHSRRELSPHD